MRILVQNLIGFLEVTEDFSVNILVILYNVLSKATNYVPLALEFFKKGVLLQFLKYLF